MCTADVALQEGVQNLKKKAFPKAPKLPRPAPLPSLSTAAKPNRATSFIKTPVRSARNPLQ